MHKLVATEPGVLEPFPTQPALLRAVRGEWVNFQVVVTAGDVPLTDVQVTGDTLVSTLGHLLEPANIVVFHERFVRAAVPSGNRRLEKLWWPDALVLMKWQPVNIAPRQSAVFWVSVRIPASTAAATYLGAVDVTTSAGTKQLFLGVTVEKTLLPPATMRATAALYYGVLRDWYAKNIGPQTDEDWLLAKRAYYDFLLDYRINAYDLPVAPDDPAFAAYARDPRVTAIRTPPLNAPDFAPFVAALDAAGARDKSFYYQHDEPQPDQYATIVADGQKLHAAGVRQLVTTAPNPKLLKAVEIWCPNIGDALGLGHLDLEALARARKRGEETWWYTMTVPRAPYPTWLLDDSASSVRLYGWQMARWGINGFVYSMVHGWGPRPLEDLRSFAGSNGDGTLLYPGEQADGHGPMPSIRLMLLRDAIEDYELLVTLPEKQRLAVLSHAVGASPAERRDTYKDWAEEGNLDRFHGAKMGRTVEMAQPQLEPLARPAIDGARKPHTTDGVFAPGEWLATAQMKTRFARFVPDTLPPSKTLLYLEQQGGRLLVALRIEDAGPNEWCAVELAPQDASERWRFVATSTGKLALEKHTREGHSRMDGLDWKAAARTVGPRTESARTGGPRTGTVTTGPTTTGATANRATANRAAANRAAANRAAGESTYEWSLPLDLVAEPGGLFRLNVLRRVDDTQREAKYTVRAWDDAGDVTRMPLARRAVAVRKRTATKPQLGAG